MDPEGNRIELWAPRANEVIQSVAHAFDDRTTTTKTLSHQESLFTTSGFGFLCLRACVVIFLT